MKFRMYIDEVGNPDLKASKDPNHRFLGLTGVIMDLEYVRVTAAPRIEALKAECFRSHPDEPIILHRKELVNRQHPFEALRSPDVERRFNEDLLTLLRELDYTVLSVVIDKLEHEHRYQTWKYDPYHYCIAILVERFVMWLRRRGARGDVMAESRGGAEDRRLKKSFRALCEHGSPFMSGEDITRVLTSVELKVKPKANNIAGLQIADLIAHPIYKEMLARQGLAHRRKTFGGEIFDVVDGKLDRSPSGVVDGWGLKWLP